MIMATAVSATKFGVFYKDTSDARVKLYMTFDLASNYQLVSPFMKFNGNLDTLKIAAQNQPSQLVLIMYGSPWINENGTTIDPKISSVWGIKDYAFSSLGTIPITEEASELTVWEDGVLANGQTANDVTLHSGIRVMNPKSNSASERVSMNLGGDLGAYLVERETNSDLSQAIGSAYSTVRGTLYLSTTKIDGIELLNTLTENFVTYNLSIPIKTNKVWIYAYPPETTTLPPPTDLPPPTQTPTQCPPPAKCGVDNKCRGILSTTSGLRLAPPVKEAAELQDKMCKDSCLRETMGNASVSKNCKCSSLLAKAVVLKPLPAKTNLWAKFTGKIVALFE